MNLVYLKIINFKIFKIFELLIDDWLLILLILNLLWFIDNKIANLRSIIILSLVFYVFLWIINNIICNLVSINFNEWINILKIFTFIQRIFNITIKLFFFLFQHKFFWLLSWNQFFFVLFFYFIMNIFKLKWVDLRRDMRWAYYWKSPTLVNFLNLHLYWFILGFKPALFCSQLIYFQLIGWKWIF